MNTGSFPEKISQHYYTYSGTNRPFLLTSIKQLSVQDWKIQALELGRHIESLANRCLYEGSTDTKGNQTQWSKAWEAMAIDVIELVRTNQLKLFHQVLNLCHKCAILLREKSVYPVLGSKAIETVKTITLSSNLIPKDDNFNYAKVLRYSVSDKLKEPLLLRENLKTETSVQSNSLESKVYEGKPASLTQKKKLCLLDESESIVRLLEADISTAFQKLSTDLDNEERTKLDERLCFEVILTYSVGRVAYQL